METPPPREWIRFKHARLTARFPSDFLYARSHYWMAPIPADPGLWRVGFTKFATRMLGELVDFTFEIKEGDPVIPGQLLGWVEGFKAASDVFSVMTGTFAGTNPALQEDACIIRSDPYLVGWLYAVRGQPEAEALDVHAYLDLLNGTIQTLQEQEHREE